MEKHDLHYTKQSIETIDVQEQIMTIQTNIPPDRRHCLAHSLKYIMRAGIKSGEDWEKDLQKALNYLHRALTGNWIDE